MTEFIGISYPKDVVQKLLKDTQGKSKFIGLLIEPDKDFVSKLKFMRVYYNEVTEEIVEFRAFDLERKEEDNVEDRKKVFSLSQRKSDDSPTEIREGDIPRLAKVSARKSVPNYEIEFIRDEFHFAYVSKHDLEAILPTAKNIFISGCLINVGEYAFRPSDAGGPIADKIFFGLKIESDKRSLIELGNNGLWFFLGEFIVSAFQSIRNFFAELPKIILPHILFPKRVVENAPIPENQKQDSLEDTPVPIKSPYINFPNRKVTDAGIITGFIADNCPPWWYFLSRLTTQDLMKPGLRYALYGNSFLGKLMGAITPKFMYPTLSYVFLNKKIEDVEYEITQKIQAGWKNFTQEYAKNRGNLNQLKTDNYSKSPKSEGVKP